MGIKYFNGTQELSQVRGYPNAQFFAAGGVRSKANRYDSFERLMGRAPDGRILPVERAIAYKALPSRHTCNGKCMNGSVNGVCECQCGGKNHGIGSVTK